MNVSERFYRHTIPEPNSGCLLWIGSANEHGRGFFQMDGRLQRAPRVAWQIERGPIPGDGTCVLHRCDVPACVRIDHLFLGTHADNMADARAKGRLAAALRRRTHCSRGHEYTPETSRIRRGHRECLTCKKAARPAQQKRYRIRRKERHNG